MKRQPAYQMQSSLVIRMLTEMVKYGHKVEEEVKAMLREIKEKENVQGTN